MSWSMHLHRNLPESEKYIWIIQKLKSLDSFILTSRDNWVSCNQTLGCLRLYGDSRVSQTQPRINAYEILLQHDWLLVFSRQNRFAETHSHLQLSYHITDRLLAAGNKYFALRYAKMVSYFWFSLHRSYFCTTNVLIFCRHGDANSTFTPLLQKKFHFIEY